MRRGPLAATLSAVAVAAAVGGGVLVASTDGTTPPPAAAAVTVGGHDDAAAIDRITGAQAELSAAVDNLTAPPPTVTVTATETVTATATVTATPAPARAYPQVASVYQNSGESWADACVRTMTYGYTGCVRYLPAGTAIAWDAQWQALAAKAGSKPLDLQLTAKTYSAAGLQSVAASLPAAWRDGFKFNYYQEPEDNLLDAASQKAYRDVYTSAAPILTAAGLSKPWVEWQEWTTDPGNTKGWDLANFTPPAGDYAGVLWSLFEYGERPDRLAAQVDRIKAATVKYAPGKPFAMMAGGYSLEPGGGPFTDAQRQAQAAWLTNSRKAMRDAGSTGYAWFNYLFPGTGGAAGEARVELNPAALDALKAG